MLTAMSSGMLINLIQDTVAACKRYDSMAGRNVQSVAAWYSMADRLMDAAHYLQSYTGSANEGYIQRAIDRGNAAYATARRIRRTQLINGGL